MRLRHRAAITAAAGGLLAGCAIYAVDPAAVVPVSSATPARTAASTGGPVGTDRPNVFLITVDDAAPGDFRYLPHVQRLLADDGVTLTGAIAPSPICVPARASLLTGQYAHNHGARTISGPHGGFASFEDHHTLPVWLQGAGYTTMFVGKYLNGYGEGNPPRAIPPGWDQWHATVDPSTYNFMAPTTNDNGRLTTHHRYSTYVIRDQVDRLIDQRAHDRAPWYLWANYVAPHVGGPRDSDDPRDFSTTRPAAQDRDSFSHLPLPRTPDLFRTTAHGRSKFTPYQESELREVNQQRVEALQAVDRAVASHVRELRRTHQWRNTVVILTSDNGYAVGQHNTIGKLWYYREISTIPAIIRGPGVPSGRTVGTLVSNPDIAVTIAAIAHAATTGRQVDGSDIRPFLAEPDRPRAVALEAWRVTNGDVKLYTGVRDGPWTYVRYNHRRREVLYDHATDPYELHDLARSQRPAVRAELAHLRALARRLATCAGAVCQRLSEG